MSVKRVPASILLICDTYPPVMGGSEIEAQRVSVGLMRRGHAVQVLCAGGPPMPPVRDWVDPEGVPVRILTRRSRGRWKDMSFALQVAWTIWGERHRYDVIYFLMQGLHLLAGLPVARMLRKPTVVKIAGSIVIPLMRGSRAGRVELNWLQRWKVPLMVLNDGMMDQALADGFSRDQLIWMPNPVDTETFRPAQSSESSEWRRRHDVPQEVAVAIYVGRLAPEKGLVELLKGFAAALRSFPAALLIIVGDGPLRSELEGVCRELKLDSRAVRFIGRVGSGEVPCWLRASDVYALTSPSEGFSCALLEAMASGLPSVVSAIPANVQLISDGVHGLTAGWNDHEGIGEALSRLFSDPGLRRQMGCAARARVVENYSTDRVVDRYETLLAGITAVNTGEGLS